MRNPAAIAALAGVTALDVAAASAVTREENRPPQIFDYSSRTGFSRPVDQVRGIARISQDLGLSAKKERASARSFHRNRS